MHIRVAGDNLVTVDSKKSFKPAVLNPSFAQSRLGILAATTPVQW